MDRFSTLITNWYRQNARSLPWRNTNDPYLLWLSEIILQQTRVDQGISYYNKFALKYPSVKDLANAPQDEVLNLWQGLGYYSRARNMQAAAQFIESEYGGSFPDTYEKIIALKGVGEYTASAIASFAFDLPFAVVDGNVYRLLSRYLNIDDPIDTGSGKKLFAKVASELLDKNNPALHNQAIMEMGAIVCTPKNPRCEECPLIDSCIAREKGLIEVRPVKSKKTKVRSRFFNYLVIVKDDSLFIKKRGSKDVWEGLYDFPLVETDSENGFEKIAKDNGITLLRLDGEMKHILSHQRIYAKFWLAAATQTELFSQKWICVKFKDLVNYPMPQLLIRYLDSSSLISTD